MRYWQSGLETGDVAPGLTEWDGPQNVVNFHLDSAVVRSGNFSGRFDGQGFIQSRNGNVLGGSYARFYLRFSNAPSYYTSLFEMKGAGDTPLLGVFLMPVGTPSEERRLELFNTEDGFRIGLSTTQLNPNQWYCIEVLCGAPGGTARMKIDTVLEITEPIGNGWTPIATDRLQFGPRNHDPGCQLWFDDCAWNVPDTARPSGPQNSWCGPGAVFNYSPVIDGDLLQWTPANGGAHYVEIDELPGVPDTSSYLKTTLVGAQDRFRFPLVAAPGGIGAICFGLRGGVMTTGAKHAPAPTAKLTLLDGIGSLVDSALLDWSVVGYHTTYPALSRDRTWDGLLAPLTDLYVNSLQAAAIAVTTPRELRVTALWMSVDIP